MTPETDTDKPRERADGQLYMPPSGFYHKAFCDACGLQDEGLREHLRLRGWYISRREEFCPRCNLEGLK